MVLTCSACSRAHPINAHYCYFDGRPLPGAQSNGTATVSSNFPHPFVFPSGTSCQNYDELAKACQTHWPEARTMLRQGQFDGFLSTLGRFDLINAARAAANFPDPDRGLDQFLSQLPTNTLPPPKLKVAQTTINLGKLTANTDRQFFLDITNDGQRLLYGCITSGVDWLTIGEAPGLGQKLFQFSTQGKVQVHVNGNKLRAGMKPIEGQLSIDSNGGTIGVIVKAHVPAQPFSEGMLKGARTPRELASKARTDPAKAAPLFESGAVARWYQANGWQFPVQMPYATGVGAVQQFFEALGLVKAPVVTISDNAVSLNVAPGQKIHYLLKVSSQERRPVFASARSEQPWLRIGQVEFKGNVANIPIEAGPISAQPGQRFHNKVFIAANGNQRFAIPVTVTLTAGRAATPPPLPVPGNSNVFQFKPDTLAPQGKQGNSAETMQAMMPPAPPPPPMPRQPHGQSPQGAQPTMPAPPPPMPPRGQSSQRVQAKQPPAPSRRIPNSNSAQTQSNQISNNYWIHCIPAIALLLLLLIISIIDAYSKPKETEPEIALKDEEVEVQKAVTPPPMEVTISDEVEENFGGPTALPVEVRIEDEPVENAANVGEVEVKIEDEPTEVVGKNGGKKYPVDPNPRISFLYGGNGEWGVSDSRTFKKLTYSTSGSTSHTLVKVDGRTATFNTGVRERVLTRKMGNRGLVEYRSVWRFGAIEYTQHLEVVPSKQPVEIAPGVKRFFKDTLLVKHTMRNTDTRVHAAGIRFQVDTLIGGNDGVPFTIPGQQGLVSRYKDFRGKQVPDFIQALERYNLSNPGTIVLISMKLGVGIDPPDRISLFSWRRNTRLWEQPRSDPGSDSAVALYWEAKDIAPGGSRTIGFAYGLGNVTATNAGKMALSLNGDYEPGKTFNITAYVKNPVPNQTLTLELPAGLTRVEGKEVERVPAADNQQTSIVNWKVRVDRTGTFPVKVKSSTGVTQAKTITISRNALENNVELQLLGPYEPGKEFTAIAKVKGPKANETITLILPPGLKATQGALTQTLPPTGVTNISQVSWKVKVADVGKYPVRVRSITGNARQKNITITRPEAREGGMEVELKGPFAPGKVFTVLASVPTPVPNQTIKLETSQGLDIVQGGVTQIVPPKIANNPPTKVSWGVKVAGPAKHHVMLTSSSGHKVKKVISIRKSSSDAGKFTFAITGEVGVGSDFTITAKVKDPVPKQTLTLKIPEQLELRSANAKQSVPTPSNGISELSWRVRVLEVGTIPIRIESSTGVARTKTMTLKGSDKSKAKKLFGG